MNTLRPAGFALALALFALGCGDPDTKTLISDGHTSLDEGDAAAALAHFQDAVRGLKTDDPDYIEAKLGEIDALISLDAIKARDEFLVLAQVRPDRIGQATYIDFAGKMANGRRFVEAIDLTHAGLERFGKDTTRLRNQMTYIRQEAQSANDAPALERLRTLGYIE